MASLEMLLVTIKHPHIFNYNVEVKFERVGALFIKLH